MENETKNSRDDEQVPNLPDHLIINNILPRLPIKSLIRFKSVCKSWMFTITSGEFVKSHLKFSSPSPQYLLFVRHNPSQQRRVVSCSCDESSRVEELVDTGFTYSGENEVHVVGSSNNLVCFHDENYKFCVWNPATRYYHYINRPDYRKQNQHFVAVGFGYVSSIDDYRIACLISFGLAAELKLYIYSLRAAKWDKMAGYGYDGRKIARVDASSVMINDTLYWPPVITRDNENPVVGVNLVSGEFTQIPMKMDYTPVTVKLFETKGRLACCCYHGGRLYVVWMLRRDGSGWMKLYELYFRDGMDLIYSAANGKSLILKDSYLMLVDPSQVFLGKFGKGAFFGQVDIAIALEYKASLVSPDCW